MRGQDADRLMEEIETYLATGRGPRPAPEPKRHRAKRPSRFGLRRLLLRAWSHPGVRAGLVVAVLAAVVIVEGRHSASGSDGPDHASAAPAGPDYSFLHTNPSGTPMRWNPCGPVHYRTNLAEAPRNAADDLAQAIEKVSGATGIRFVDDGSTTTIPDSRSEQRATTQRSPVVIAWATPGETDLLTQPPLAGLGVHELGIGGPGALIDPATGHGVYVSGIVVIDSAASTHLAPGFGPGSLGVVLMHELGHLVGLGHTDDANEIMDPIVQPAKDGTWGAGDLAGLSRLGVESGCLHAPGRGASVVR
jgi:hypothetical protein